MSQTSGEGGQLPVEFKFLDPGLANLDERFSQIIGENEAWSSYLEAASSAKDAAQRALSGFGADNVGLEVNSRRVGVVAATQHSQEVDHGKSWRSLLAWKPDGTAYLVVNTTELLLPRGVEFRTETYYFLHEGISASDLTVVIDHADEAADGSFGPYLESPNIDSVSLLAPEEFFNYVPAIRQNTNPAILDSYRRFGLRAQEVLAWFSDATIDFPNRPTN